MAHEGPQFCLIWNSPKAKSKRQACSLKLLGDVSALTPLPLTLAGAPRRRRQGNHLRILLSDRESLCWYVLWRREPGWPNAGADRWVPAGGDRSACVRTGRMPDVAAAAPPGPRGWRLRDYLNVLAPPAAAGGAEALHALNAHESRRDPAPAGCYSSLRPGLAGGGDATHRILHFWRTVRCSVSGAEAPCRTLSSECDEGTNRNSTCRSCPSCSISCCTSGQSS